MTFHHHNPPQKKVSQSVSYPGPTVATRACARTPDPSHASTTPEYIRGHFNERDSRGLPGPLVPPSASSAHQLVKPTRSSRNGPLGLAIRRRARTCEHARTHHVARGVREPVARSADSCAGLPVHQASPPRDVRVRGDSSSSSLGGQGCASRRVASRRAGAPDAESAVAVVDAGHHRLLELVDAGHHRLLELVPAQRRLVLAEWVERDRAVVVHRPSAVLAARTGRRACRRARCTHRTSQPRGRPTNAFPLCGTLPLPDAR